MNLSFTDFIEKHLSQSLKLYPYQKEFLKNIENNNEPFNYHTMLLKQRQNERRYWHMLNLYWSLLSNKSVLDLFLRLFFRFETNEDGEMELQIDVYSQDSARLGKGYIERDQEGNIIKCHVLFDSTDKAKDYYKEMKKALKVIKEIT